MALSGSFRLWDHHSSLALAKYGVGTLLCLTLALCAGFSARRSGTWQITAMGSAAVLPLVLISDWVTRPYGFYPGLAVRGEILLLTLGSFLVLRRLPHLLSVLALLAPIFLGWWFFSYVGTRQLVSDDHSSVFFRLQLLKDNFPNIPHYLPLWNGGIEWRDFFGTGILNLYLLFWPLIEAWPLEQSYTLLVALVAFAVLPLSVYCGARMLDLDRLAGSCAAILSLCFSLVWYRWVLKYGAMGFVTSAALVPAVFCLSARFIERRGKLSLLSCLTVVILGSLALCWPLMALFFIPLLLVAAPNMIQLLRRWQFWTVLCLLMMINLPWGVLFWKVSKVDKFITLGEEGDALSGHGQEIGQIPDPDQHWDTALAASSNKSINFKAGVRTLREAASSTNPLVFVFALPGLALLGGRRVRSVFILMMLEGVLLGAAVSQLKPQYELERMMMLACLLLCVPAGAAIAELLRRCASEGARPGERMLGALTIACLVCGIFVSAWISQNRSYERFGLNSASSAKLAKLIRENAATGRIAFTGFVLHELDGGHIAPLVFSTGKPLLTAAPTHSRWSYTELVPEEYKSRGIPGIEEYFELMNVSVVAAHEADWRGLLDAHPESYLPLGAAGAFTLYKRVRWQPSYFLSGSGAVLSQDSGGLVVRMDSAEAVLKFNYLPFLKSSACALSPAKVGASAVLIRVTACTPGAEISIRAGKPWERLL